MPFAHPAHTILRKALAAFMAGALALSLLAGAPLRADAADAESAAPAYQVHMKKADDPSANSICDKLFSRVADVAPDEAGNVDVTLYVADPVPNFASAGQSLKSVEVIYGGSTYPAALHTDKKVSKPFEADTMFFPKAGSYPATPITFTLPQAALADSAAHKVTCRAFVNMLGVEQDFLMVFQEQQGETPGGGSDDPSDPTKPGSGSDDPAKPTDPKPTPSKPAKKPSKKTNKKKSQAAKTTVCTYSYRASFRKATSFGAASICDPLFASKADVVVSGDLAKITVYVIDPIPNYTSEGTPLSSVKFTYGGKTYAASYLSGQKTRKSFGSSSMFIAKAGTYPATPITVTLPKAAVAASAKGGLKCQAFVRAVLKSTQSFYVVLTNGSLISKTNSTAGLTRSGSASLNATGGSAALSDLAADEDDAEEAEDAAEPDAPSVASAKDEANCMTGTAHGTYTHPVTQEVADSAGPVGQAMGQAMIGKVIDKQCMLETTEEGSWLNTRWHLTNAISDVVLQTQEPGDEDWADVDYGITAEGDDQFDLRLPVASEETIIKAQAHIKPINRDVTFFVYGDNWVDGNAGNFAVLGTSGQSSGKGAPASATAPNAGVGFWITLFLVVFCAAFLGVVLANLTSRRLGIRERKKRARKPSSDSDISQRA